jgi:hypothetical protein
MNEQNMISFLDNLINEQQLLTNKIKNKKAKDNFKLEERELGIINQLITQVLKLKNLLKLIEEEK